MQQVHCEECGEVTPSYDIVSYGFGRMLMTFEGWQFKLEIGDPSDEL